MSSQLQTGLLKFHASAGLGGNVLAQLAATADTLTLTSAGGSGVKITGVATPSAASDAASKSYVDSSQAGLDAKESVVCASKTTMTIGNGVTEWGYNSGTAGVGATLTYGTNAASSDGAHTTFFDGITLASGNRVLVKDASKTDANGIYTCTNAGGAGAKVILTRATDHDTTGATGEVHAGNFVFVEQGSTQHSQGFVMKTNSNWTNKSYPDAISGDNTAANRMEWTQFSGAGSNGATTDGTETLTNKTLTDPTINAATLTGAVTLTDNSANAVTFDSSGKTGILKIVTTDNGEKVTMSGGLEVAGTTTSTGRVLVDDTTEASSTTDGSLQTDGGLSVAKSAIIGDNLKLLSDSSILSFGADSDTTLTHTDGTGLTLNSTNKLCFGDTGTYVNQSSDGVLALVSDTTVAVTGAATFSSTLTCSGAILPNASDSVALGSATKEFSDLFLADGAVINMGDDQDITLTHVADSGITLKNSATGDDKPFTLTLQTGETDIAVDDVLGVINFQAPDEGTGTDAILVAAGIAAVSEGDFSATSNATKLSFRTAASEVATEKMSLSSAGVLSVGSGSANATVQSNGDHNLILQTGNSTTGSITITDGANGDITLAPNGTGKLVLDGLNWPTADGSDGQVLVTDGSGSISFSDVSSTTITITANNTTDETVYFTFVDGATGSQGLETDTGLTYNPLENKISITDTTTSSATEGSGIRLASNDGAAMGDGHRLGVIEFAGAEDASDTITVGARIESVCDAAWSATENGASLVFYTTDGNASQSQVLKIDSNKLATFAGRVITDDATDATTTSDGSLQTDGGLSVVKDCVFGNDVKLLSDSAVLSLGTDSDATFTHDGTTGLTIAANPITLDSAGDIVLDADGADVVFKDGGTEIGKFTNSSSDFVITSSVQDKDIVFKGDDGGSAITALTLDMSEAGAASFNSTVSATSYTSTSDVQFKKNINSLANYESKFDQLRPVTFNWKDDFSNDSNTQVGLIAQEVEQVFPEAVYNNDHKSINYQYFTSMLIKEVQLLRNRVQLLEQ